MDLRKKLLPMIDDEWVIFAMTPPKTRQEFRTPTPPAAPLTPWFRATDKPVRDGWYLADYTHLYPGMRRPVMLMKEFRNNQWWSSLMDRPEEDLDFTWRGLTSPME